MQLMGEARMQRMLHVFLCILAVMIGAALSASAASQISGEAVYRQRCASCHELVDSRIPHREALQKMTASRILRSLDFGVMISVAYPLRRDERQAVAAYLGLPGADSTPNANAFCTDRSIKIAAGPKANWNGWSPTAANTRFQSREGAALTPDQLQRLKLKWAFGFDGDVNAFAQPTILDQNLFVGSAGGSVHALSVETGCIKWVFQADGPVRSAILAVPSGQRHALLFGDQTGWFYSLDAETGRLLWKKQIEDHEAARITGATVAYQNTVFVPIASWEETRALNPDYPCCTFRGSVVALRIRDGSLAWKTYMVPDKPRMTGKTRVGTPTWGPSGAGVWAAPTIDAKRRRLYVTTGDNYSSPATSTSDAVMALDLSNGRIVWTRQTTPGDAYNSSCGNQGPSCPEENGPDYDYGSSALMVALSSGRELLVAGQKSGVVYALDPERKGEIVWQTRVGKGGINGGVQWGMASDGQNVYAAVSDGIRTRRTPTPSDPIAVDLDPRVGGGLTALNPGNGEKVWYATPAPCDKPRCSPAQSAAVTAIPGVIFSGSVDGHLRAFGAEDGRVVWDFDTVREYETANGVKARGGSLDGPGVVVAGGMVFVNSGYARNGGMPGNVLLAFTPEN
jgi:polyvinyl alcohol dehydrogenase (cytochrome)